MYSSGLLCNLTSESFQSLAKYWFWGNLFLNILCIWEEYFHQYCFSSGHTIVTGGKGAGHSFWKNDIAQGHNINQLESSGTKMADKTRPWSSISRWNDTTRGAMTVPKWKWLIRVWLLRPHVLFSPWNSPGQNTGVGSLSLLQGIIKGSNLGFQHCGRILYQLSHKGSPRILAWVAYPFSSGSSQPRNGTRVLHCRWILYQLSYQGRPKWVEKYS